MPKPTKEVFFKGLKIAWNGAKWVATKNPYVKAAWYALEAYDAIVTGTELAHWASGKMPAYKPPPRIDTGYEFSGNMGMTYEHFDGSWQRFPPLGYDRFGALIK